MERLRPAVTNTKLLGLRALLDAVLTAPRDANGKLPLDALATRLGRTVRSAWSLLQAAEALRLVIVDRSTGMRVPHGVRLDFDGLRLVAREGTPPSLATLPAKPEPAGAIVAEAVDEPGGVSVGSGVSPSSLVFAHVRKSFPNDRKIFPNGKPTPDDVCFIYLPPYPPKPVLETETAGGGADFENARGTERAAFGEPVRCEPGRSEPGPADLQNAEPDWGGAAASLKKAGVEATKPAIAAAQARGLDPAAVVAACATFAANRAKFKSAGALRFWIATGGWPTDAPVVDPADLERRRADAEAKQTRQRVEHETAVAVNAAETDAAEHDHGAELDALGEAERDALAVDKLKAPGLLDAYRRGRWRERGSLVRDCLLAALDARAAVANSL